MPSWICHPDVLVSTDWVAEHSTTPTIRIVESNEDTLLYASGHIPGAVHVDWTADLNDQIRRDYITRDGFEALMSRIGVTPDTTVVFYGDKNNWWACYAFWVFQLFGHTNAKVMDGGRLKWEKEGRELIARRCRRYAATQLQGAGARRRARIRAFRDEVLQHVRGEGPARRRAQPRRVHRQAAAHARLPERRRAARRPHPRREERAVGARRSIPRTARSRPPTSCRSIYVRRAGASTGDEPIIAYCRIGERSSHTWFALTYLLGFQNVRNYDGSWTEWGNLVGVPIEK